MRGTFLLNTLTLSVLLWLPPSCGGAEGDGADSDSAPGDGDGDGDEETGEGDGDQGGSTSDCSEGAPTGLCVRNVSGAVLGVDDEPVEALRVTVCGPVCYIGVTDQEGRFAVAVDSFLLPSEYSVQPHGSPEGTTYYYPLDPDLSPGDVDVGTLRVLPLAEVGTEIVTKLDLEGEVSPAQELTAGAVSVSVREGTVVRLSVADALLYEEGRLFRSRELSASEMEMFGTPEDLERVFALGPFEANFEGEAPEVSVRIANTTGYPAGAEVEVWALGTYLDPDWLSPSEFESIGTATVSSDSAFIELAYDAPGPGLRHLTWIGLAPEP